MNFQIKIDLMFFNIKNTFLKFIRYRNLNIIFFKVKIDKIVSNINGVCLVFYVQLLLHFSIQYTTSVLFTDVNSHSNKKDQTTAVHPTVVPQHPQGY